MRSTRFWRARVAKLVVMAIAVTVVGVPPVTAQSKPPIIVHSIGTYTSSRGNFPFALAAVKAGVEAINKRGGIGGRPLKVTYCSDEATSSGSMRCARKAVADKAVAVIGWFSALGAGHDILANAKIPVIGNYANIDDDLSSAMAFPLVGGSYTLMAGEVALLARNRVKKISVVVPDSSSAPLLIEAARAAAKLRDVEIVNIVRVPTGAPDGTPYAFAARANGAEGVALNSAGQDLQKIARALRQTGSDIPISIPDQGPNVIRAAAAELEGAYVVNWVKPLDSRNKQIATFLAESKAADSKFTTASVPLPAIALINWASTQILERALKAVSGAITPTSITTAMRTLGKIDLGFVGSVDYSKPYPNARFKRLFNPNVLYGGIRNGRAFYTDLNFDNPLR